MIPDFGLTNNRKFAAHVGAYGPPEPNIAVSMPIDLPSNFGGSVVVGAHHA